MNTQNFNMLLNESNNEFKQLFESNNEIDEFNKVQAKGLNKILPELIDLLDKAYINGQIDKTKNDPICELFSKHGINIYNDFEVVRSKLVKLNKDLNKIL